jgi:cob(I)alamin adenosyltransferase
MGTVLGVFIGIGRAAGDLLVKGKALERIPFTVDEKRKAGMIVRVMRFGQCNAKGKENQQTYQYAPYQTDKCQMLFTQIFKPFHANLVYQMAFEDYKTKKSVVVVYTGEGKGKTSAGLGLLARALGNRWNVAFIQFIKYWGVGEHVFIHDIQSLYEDQLYFYKGGKGFYDAGEMSAEGVSQEQHQKAADDTYKEAYSAAAEGKYDLVICDEINNAVHDGLLKIGQVEKLIKERHPKTSLCLTGRDFPEKLLDNVDIATGMTKLKHHFDDKFLANRGIDF